MRYVKWGKEMKIRQNQISQDIKQNIYSKIVKSMIAVMLSAFLSFTLMTPAYGQSSDEGRKTVKAGFFQLSGYHEMDAGGVSSGYGYDFLKKIQIYNNWNYEFTGYEKSWGDMLDMLDQGKIDLVTFAQKTPERQGKYDFSDSPIGTGCFILTAKMGDDRFAIGDVSAYHEKRIGITMGTTHEDILNTFAKENGFSYTPVYYSRQEDMARDLFAGENIDLYISSSLRTIDGEMILEEMNPQEFYVIVKKGNTELLNEINDAIDQLDIDEPGWRLTLKNKYFGTNAGKNVALDKKEREYLAEQKEKDKVLSVVSNPDLAPYSYYEDGKAKGIVPEIFREIAARTGLQYEFIPMDNYEKYNEYVRAKKADIDLTCFYDYGLADYHHVNLSKAYLSTTLAMLTKNTFNGKVQKIAAVEGETYNTSYSEALLERNGAVIYSTHQECIEAVKKGNVDATYLYTYTAQKAVKEDVKNSLSYSIMPEYTVDLAIGVNEDSDYRLLQIIDEGIKSVKGNYAIHVIEDDLAQITEQDTLLAFFYDYPAQTLLAMGIVLCFGFFVILYVVKYIAERKQIQQAMELSRFMGYVCEVNEMVMEVDLQNHTCVRHNMENGVLTSQNVSYDPEIYKSTLWQEDIADLLEEADTSDLWKIFKNNGKGRYFEARSQKSDNGAFYWYAYTIRVIPKDKKHPDNFIVFKKNIDDVKQKEEKSRQVLEDALETARSASMAKGQFLSRMSHEIRTPLNAVIGYMNIAKDSEKDPQKMMHCIENSDAAAKHLLSIINDVLDISSIESGKMKIACEDFDLKKQLTTISTLFYNQANKKKANFEVRLHEITDEWVIGDSLRVNQILMNLLSNAVKFTPEGGTITLSVSQMKTEDTRVFMKFEVSDTGIGMSEEYQKKLFQPFEQESARTAQKYGGSGLGLSITYNLVQMMGGSIDVKSQLEKGTTFVVLLHFNRSKKNVESEMVQRDYSHVRVLLVDDDEGSCEYMKALLKRCKVKCDVVCDGASAVRKIKLRMGTDYKYDFCIMDWQMPGSNGIATAKRIHEECTQDIPIIIATAYDVVSLETEAKNAGIDRVISKPLFQSTMFDLLVSTYGKYEPVEEVQDKMLDLEGLRVLLAEDNPMNMEIAVDILEKVGIQVDQVTDGRQAVDRFTGEKPGTYDVILMDVQMPVLDGYAATGEIRKSSHEEAKTIPIIAMTANAFAEDVTAALASGMNGHIAKPIDYDKLFQVLGKYRK